MLCVRTSSRTRLLDRIVHNPNRDRGMTVLERYSKGFRFVRMESDLLLFPIPESAVTGI